MNKQVPIYIISYYNYSDKRTLVGGLRPYYLYEKLRKDDWNVKLITPEKSNVDSLTITENKFLHLLRPILRIFPPDYSIFWGIKIFFYLKKANKFNKFIVFTTVPPHGLGIIGLLCKLFLKNAIWISDYRDLWTENPLYNPPFTKKYIDPIFEKKFHKYSDLVVFNTKWDLEFNIKLFPNIINKSIFVRNGFNFQLINKSKSEMNFVYAGGTTKGEATRRIIKLLEEINSENNLYTCDFYGEYNKELEDCKFINYLGTIEPDKVAELLTNYKFGFIYLPKGCENGGRMAQKFYDYIGSGVTPICFNPSLEMQEIMNEIKVGFSIFKETKNSEIIDYISNVELFDYTKSELLKFSREYQFNYLIQNLSRNLEI
jgi:glycosyltransferase involved in cell wall biosynthesis